MKLEKINKELEIYNNIEDETNENKNVEINDKEIGVQEKDVKIKMVIEEKEDRKNIFINSKFIVCVTILKFL